MKLRGASMVYDADEVERRIARCACPWTATMSAGFLAIEHYHETGCPALDEHRDTETETTGGES